MFIFHTNLYAGLIAAACAALTSSVFSMNTDYRLYLFIFFSATFVYNFDRTANLSLDRFSSPVRFQFMNRYRKPMFVFTWISFLGGLSLFFFLGRSAMAAASFAALVTILYFLLNQFKKISYPLRSGLKQPFLALTWAVVTVLLPALESRTAMDRHFLYFFISFYILFTVAGLWFDFKDAEGDMTSLKSNPANLMQEKSFLYMMTFICAANLIHTSLLVKSLPLILLSGYYLFNSLFYRELKILTGRDEKMYLIFIDAPLFIIPAAAVLGDISRFFS